jgi:hypothetical protein
MSKEKRGHESLLFFDKGFSFLGMFLFLLLRYSSEFLSSLLSDLMGNGLSQRNFFVTMRACYDLIRHESPPYDGVDNILQTFLKLHLMLTCSSLTLLNRSSPMGMLFSASIKRDCMSLMFPLMSQLYVLYKANGHCSVESDNLEGI